MTAGFPSLPFSLRNKKTGRVLCALLIIRILGRLSGSGLIPMVVYNRAGQERNDSERRLSTKGIGPPGYKLFNSAKRPHLHPVIGRPLTTEVFGLKV